MNTYTLRELLDLMAELHPVQTFLISPESNKQLTFGELREQSRIISLDLLRKGLQPGDKVAFLLDNGLFTAQLFLGNNVRRVRRCTAECSRRRFPTFLHARSLRRQSGLRQ